MWHLNPTWIPSFFQLHPPPLPAPVGAAPSPGPCRHDGAAALGAELRDGPIQHVDLVEEIHGWKGNALR